MSLHEHIAHRQFRREILEDDAVRETARRIYHWDAKFRWIRIETGSWGGRPTTEVTIGYTSQELDDSLDAAAEAVGRRYLP